MEKVKEVYRRLSGEKTSQTPDQGKISPLQQVRPDQAAGLSGNGDLNDNNKTSDGNGLPNSPDFNIIENCGECKKAFTSIRLKTSTECCLCGEWICQVCTKFKKTDTIINREDVFYTCKPCMPRMHNLIKTSKSEALTGDKNNTNINHEQILLKLNEMQVNIETKFDDLNKAMAKAVQTPEVVETSVTKAINSTLLSQEDLPKETENNEDDSDWVTVARRKPATLHQIIKKSMNDVSEEQSSNEKRRNNLILHRAPELESDDSKERIKNDKKLVSDLLEKIGVNASPIKVYRLGKLDPSKQGTFRPLKVEFKNSNIQKEIMTKANNLKDAQGSLKNISISYDLSQDQRKEVKDLVEEAKSKSKNSTTHYYRVIGEPGKMKVHRFLKNKK